MPDSEATDPPLLYTAHVFCCVNVRPQTHRRGCCASKGSQELANYMCRRAMVTANQMRIRVNLSGCLNACEYGPTMVIYPEGVWYHARTAEDIDEILITHLQGGGRVERLMLQPDQKSL